MELVKEELEWLHAIWARGGSTKRSRLEPVAVQSEVAKTDLFTPEQWERALGRLVVGREVDDEIGAELAREPGVQVVQRLIHEFRASMIIRVLRLTSRFIMLMMGTEAFRTILGDYWSRVTPQMYASSEADSFAQHLRALDLQLPHLGKILEFEQAVTATNIDGSTRVVHFDFEPFRIGECARIRWRVGICNAAIDSRHFNLRPLRFLLS